MATIVRFKYIQSPLTINIAVSAYHPFIANYLVSILCGFSLVLVCDVIFRVIYSLAIMTENVDLLVISELLSESFGCMCLTVRLPQSATAVVCDIVIIRSSIPKVFVASIYSVISFITW